MGRLNILRSATPATLVSPCVDLYSAHTQAVSDESKRIPSGDYFQTGTARDRQPVSHQFKAILIDFYGTVCGGDRRAIESTCKRVVDACRLSMSPQRFAVRWGERFFKTIEASNHESFRTLHECELISLSATLSDLGVNADPAPFVAELDEYWRNPPIHPDAVAFLAELNTPVCCVSNADTEPILTAIDRLGLKFDHIVTSERVRCYKPESAIFRRALDLLGRTPQDVVHIGDSLHSDIAGAESAGMASIWLCREDRIHDVGKNIKPVWQCASLAEVASIISL